MLTCSRPVRPIYHALGLGQTVTINIYLPLLPFAITIKRFLRAQVIAGDQHDVV